MKASAVVGVTGVLAFGAASQVSHSTKRRRRTEALVDALAVILTLGTVKTPAASAQLVD